MSLAVLPLEMLGTVLSDISKVLDTIFCNRNYPWISTSTMVSLGLGFELLFASPPSRHQDIVNLVAL